MKTRSFLITGASGFIGANLARRLVVQGFPVHLILRPKAQLWRIKDILSRTTVHCSDLSDPGELKKIVHRARPDVIYHLAAYGAYSQQSDPDKIFTTNIFGTWNLIQAAMDHPYGLFVNTGSSSEYGFKDSPMKESDRPDPNSFYAVSKCTATHLCAYIAKAYHKPIVTLRPFAVYGPYEEPGRLVPSLMKALDEAQAISMADRHIARDFVYVSDAVDAYLKINRLQKHPGECFNIGTGRQSTIQHIAESASVVSGRKTQFGWGKMPNRAWDAESWVGDISKTKKLLGWTPKFNLKQGLAKTWLWYQTHKCFYV